MQFTNEAARPGDSRALNQPSSGHSLRSRRAFLKRLAGLGAASVFLPGLLAACGGEKSGAPGGSASSGEVAQNTAASCAESADLSLPAIATRKAVSYVDESPHAEKTCSNCRFFKEPAAGARCGGCEIAGGPIAPGGYCSAWAARG